MPTLTPTPTDPSQKTIRPKNNMSPTPFGRRGVEMGVGSGDIIPSIRSKDIEQKRGRDDGINDKLKTLYPHT